MRSATTAARRYLVEIVDKRGQRRYAESCADWETADRLRTQANERLAAVSGVAERR